MTSPSLRKLPLHPQMMLGTMRPIASPSVFGNSIGRANAISTQQKPGPRANASVPGERRRRIGTTASKSSAAFELTRPANSSGLGTMQQLPSNCGCAVVATITFAPSAFSGASAYATCAAAPQLMPSSIAGPSQSQRSISHRRMRLQCQPLPQRVNIHSGTGASSCQNESGGNDAVAPARGRLSDSDAIALTLLAITISALIFVVTGPQRHRRLLLVYRLALYLRHTHTQLPVALHPRHPVAISFSPHQTAQRYSHHPAAHHPNHPASV